jgi:hypothetical protein
MLKSSSLCLYSSNLGTFWLKIVDRLCKLEKRGNEIKKNLLGNYRANLNQTLLK